MVVECHHAVRPRTSVRRRVRPWKLFFRRSVHCACGAVRHFVCRAKRILTGRVTRIAACARLLTLQFIDITPPVPPLLYRSVFIESDVPTLPPARPRSLPSPRSSQRPPPAGALS